MGKDKRQQKDRSHGVSSLVFPVPQLSEVEKDVRALMKKCGDLTKEVENHRLAEDEQKHKILLEFIPVADALEAFSRDLVEAKVLSDRQGNELEMLGRRFARAFERSGISRLPIQPGETPLDATCHEVVRAEVRDGVADGTILDVLKPGYMLSGRVLRPAKVVVATCGG
jgi:molecular chaperone GrpE